MVSTEYLRPKDRVLIIDDFLATAQTITALARLADKVGACVIGIGAVIEKLLNMDAKTRGTSTFPLNRLPLSPTWTMERL